LLALQKISRATEVQPRCVVSNACIPATFAATISYRQCLGITLALPLGNGKIKLALIHSNTIIGRMRWLHKEGDRNDGERGSGGDEDLPRIDATFDVIVRDADGNLLHASRFQ